MKEAPRKENWTMSEKLSFDRKVGHLTDVTFIVGKDECSATFKAHKLILANVNAVFEKEFQNQSTDQLKDPIRIKDLKPAGFAILLDFLYDQHVSIQSLPTAVETFTAAFKYEVNSLMRYCENYVIGIVNRDNAVPILRLAIKLKMRFVKRISTIVIQENADYILSSHEFIELPWHMVKRITEMKHLKASKMQISYAVVRWKTSNNA
ncbi:hypothetical protein NPIL_629871 [Nephila pilipes]|uniref:BTB domain-containing protein n=1 Tax=Nephila pilipes TaxID=299642 RepID=A0A8X6QWH2_NEPPI|nr:hypothetical protein NPIL_629871 [Nephila pilipes]